jgi:hypothetical protein
MIKGLYSSNFVINILVNGQMQSINRDNTIAIPFETEYKIRLQNKNSRRAVAKVFVDDENVSEGGVILNAYQTLDLEGPVRKNRNFKFVSIHSGQAHDAGKSEDVNGEKGVIRVEFQLEAPKRPVVKKPTICTQLSPWQYGHVEDWRVTYSPSFVTNSPRHFEGYEARNSCGEEKTSGGILSAANTSKGLTGATVSGDSNNQNFVYDSFELDYSPAVILQVKLVGWAGETTQRGVFCSRCGFKAHHSYNFCTKCGNKL